MLSELKNFDAKRMDLNELVALSAFGTAFKNEFESLGVETPEWVAVNLTSLHREIKSRNADRLASRIRDARNRLETLKTPSEKKAALVKEIADLEKQAKAV